MWNVEGAEWNTEARCWVLRNRARLTEFALGVGSVSSRVTVQLGDWLDGWLGPASVRLLVVCWMGWVVSL